MSKIKKVDDVVQIGEVTSEFEVIGPHEAGQYLMRRSGQRPYSKKWGQTLARLMTEGRFDEGTCEPIGFDMHDNLINGQHRLEAIIMADKPYRFLVLRGLNPNAFKSMDQGRRRSGGDTLTVLGIPHANEASYMIRVIFGMRDNTLPSSSNTSPTKKTMTDNGAIGDFAGQHYQQVVWTATLCTGSTEVVSPGLLGAVMFLGGINKQALAEEFVHRIKTGLGQSADDPDYILRQKLLRLREMARSDRKNPRKAITPAEGIPWIVSGWNAFAQGRKLQKINPSPRVRDIEGAPRDWDELLFRRTWIIRRTPS